MFQGYILEILHLPIIIEENGMNLRRLLPLPILVTKEKDGEPIMYSIGPKNSLLWITIDEKMHFDIDKSQLEAYNRKQDKPSYEHSLVRQEIESPNSCLLGVYSGDNKGITIDCPLSVTQWS